MSWHRNLSTMSWHSTANLSGSFIVLIHRCRTRVLVIFFDIASINLSKINSLLLATKNKIMVH